MNAAEIDALDEDGDFFREVGANVWLMDDHRWAFYIWHMQRPVERLAILHADYHWDGINDFVDRPTELADLRSANDERILELVRANELITCESFIAPAVIKGFVRELHFYCLQEDTDEGIDQDILETYECRQFIHGNLASFAAQDVEQPFVFDLCLDLFNRCDRCYEGDIWSASEIEEAILALQPKIAAASLVSVSMSFGYSGTRYDTRELTKKVLPMILTYRDAA